MREKKKERKKKNKTLCPFLAILCNSWKLQNFGLICSKPGFRVDSGCIHSASHQVPRWKGVSLFEYIPIKKSELRYIQFCPPPRCSCHSRPSRPSPVITLLALFFFRSEAADPFYFWLLPFIKGEEAEGKRKKSVHRFFSRNYIAAFCSIKN